MDISHDAYDSLKHRADSAEAELAAIKASLATEQRVADVKLADSEDRYRTLFDALDAGFCVIEMKYSHEGTPVDYRFVEMNEAFIKQTGLENAQDKWIRDLAPTHEQHWFDIYGQVARTRTPVRFENAAEALGRWYEVQAIPIGAPELNQVAVLFNDVSARRQADKELRNFTSRLKAEVAARTTDRNQLWELSTDIMLRCQMSGEIIAVNPAWTNTLGWTETELLGTNLFDLIHPDDVVRTKAGAASSSEGVALRRFENRYRSKNGTYRWIDWSSQPANDIINAVGRDVTEDKEKAAALERIEDQLRQSQKMEAVGQLTGGLAHDFNNLLAGVSGSLEMLGIRFRQGRISDVEKYVVAAQGAVRRAAALTHRLLAFSRRQTLDPKPTDVNALVSGMTELIQRTVGPGVNVDAISATGLWTTLVDAGQLENALLNLCINSRDAMPTGGRITIETSNKWLDHSAAKTLDMPEGQYLALCVSDSGTGMTPDVLSQAFDPFFTTKPIGQGTGLGLSMIYGFANQSGGQVRIYSEIAQGTTVCIYLPRFHGDATNERDPAPPLTVSGAEAGGTVLVVDDEPSVRMLVTDMMEELGYTVIEAADSIAGLKILQSDIRIDLLISDVGLPGGINGRQMADAARPSRPTLKVLFITGYAENSVIGNGHLAPGMQVMTKPFSLDALAAKVRQLADAS